MKQYISQLALVIEDYDDAIQFYTQILNFTLIEDTKLSESKRWVVVSPPGSPTNGCNLLLAKAANDVQKSSIGNQSGGRVFLFLYTDDLQRDYKKLVSNNVKIVREISKHDYGTVLVFADLYGNLWDLIEPTDR